MANDNFLNDPFGSDMNNIFNNMMGNMNGYNSENRRYLINGQEVTPEQFAQYRQSGQLPQGQQATINGDSAGRQVAQSQGQPKQEGILAKLGRNLTQEARDG
ncbi:MAG: ATP-dependent Clp protease ATP-binding subunit, partial [Leuconostoc gelidum]